MLRLLLLLMSVSSSLSATDYCSLCDNGIHTMCLYPKDGPGSSCLHYKKVQFAHYQKKYIVDIHNDIRNHIASGQETKGKLGSQPPAANMYQLEWDEELAIIAQRWADQCIPINATKQHDVCKKTNKFNHVGQNILTAVTNTTDIPELAILILNWYKQVVDVIPSDIDYFEGIKRGQFLIGQYTQLVWAKTKAVGCGMAIYKEASRGFNQRLVCNYGPGGNIIGQPVYLQGVPCSKCPKGRCDIFRKNLCESSSTKSAPRSLFGFYINMEKVFGKEGNLCVFSPELGKMHLDECRTFLDDVLTETSTEVTIVYSDLTEMRTETSLTSANRIRYKRAVGKWYNGDCKCDQEYRSNCLVLFPVIYLIIFGPAIVFYN